RKTAIILAILIVLTLSVRVIDIDKPYETWDEITTYSIGLNLWFNVLSGDFSPETWKTYSLDYTGSLHPPLARFTYGIVNGIYIFSQTGTSVLSSGYDDAVYTMYVLKNLAPGRALSAAFAAATTVLIFLLSRKYFGLNVAILASIIFALLPVSIAQTKLAALDAMLVFMYTITIYFFIRGLKERKYFYLSLIFTGLSIATKYNSATLFILLPLIYFTFGKKKVIQKKHLFLLPVVAIIILFLVWPRFWPDPIGGAMTNITGWLSMTGDTGVVPEYFLGGFVHPEHYEITYVLVTMPVIILAFFILGIAHSLKRRSFGDKTVLLWFAIPLLLYSLFAFRMSGPRYVFMIYPAIAVLSAVGMMKLMDWLRGAKKYGKYFYYIIPILTVMYLIATAVAVHPFYLDYYNEAVGGPENVYENNMFAIGQWGQGIGTATFWLNDNAKEDSTVQFYVMPRHVIPPIREDITDLTPFIPKYLSDIDENEKWVMTDVEPEAQYLVENTYFRLYLNTTFHDIISKDYDLIYMLKVEGAPLAWIYEKKS
ncbi:MAG: glycosyltransferase family 39 protein, partial [Candidatus Aenigmatarchaeota archaeon]